MKKNQIFLAITMIAGAFLLTSCGAPVTLTSWKNPEVTGQISKVAVMPLFEKIEFTKPFEVTMVAYFNSRGLKSIGSLDFLNPAIKYEINDIKHRCDSLGVDAILLFTYQGMDKTESYVPPTTYYTAGYGGYGGYWAGGYWGGYSGGYYGGYYGGTVATTGGYWTTSKTLNLSAKLYIKGSKDALWTGELTVTDPEYIDQVANTMAQYIYSDWQNQKLIKFTGKAK
ncbi:MAG: hypothetical protein WCI71_07235 [Bacteroidota bacterium]